METISQELLDKVKYYVLNLKQYAVGCKMCGNIKPLIILKSGIQYLETNTFIIPFYCPNCGHILFFNSAIISPLDFGKICPKPL